MKLTDLLCGGMIKPFTKVMLSEDDGGGSFTLPEKIGDTPIRLLMSYGDREVVRLSGVNDHLNIIIEREQYE